MTVTDRSRQVETDRHTYVCMYRLDRQLHERTHSMTDNMGTVGHTVPGDQPENVGKHS